MGKLSRSSYLSQSKESYSIRLTTQVSVLSVVYIIDCLIIIKFNLNRTELNYDQLNADLELSDDSDDSDLMMLESVENDQRRRPKLGQLDRSNWDKDSNVLFATRPGSLDSTWADGTIESIISISSVSIRISVCSNFSI